MKYKSLLALALALMLPAGALAATEELSGTVTAGVEISVPAPQSGTVSSTFYRVGQWLEPGDALASLELSRVFSPVDGTVATLDAEPGDDASATVMTILPVSKYTLTCSTDDLYGTTDPSRFYVRLGETLHIRCTKDRSHVAVGVVTGVDGSSYTVETTGGELYLEEEVNLYREPYAFSQWVGIGTVARTEVISLTGSGTLLETFVQPGDTVERGQLLFTCAQSTVGSYLPKDGMIRVDSAGVLASCNLSAGMSVQQNASVATLYPLKGFQLAVTVPEDMLPYISPGDTLRFYLDWDEEPRWYEGVVSSMAYQADQTPGSATTFTAYVDFEADPSVRLGMSALVEVEVP